MQQNGLAYRGNPAWALISRLAFVLFVPIVIFLAVGAIILLVASIGFLIDRWMERRRRSEAERVWLEQEHKDKIERERRASEEELSKQIEAVRIEEEAELREQQRKERIRLELERKQERSPEEAIDDALDDFG